MTKKLDERAFESSMMKEFADLRLMAGIQVPEDPERAAYNGYRAGRMVTRDEVNKANEKKREATHVIE
jgi:hypothetical protein